MLNEFITYLLEQVGQPYLWGGQHTKLTPENYVAVIDRKEAGHGGYKDKNGNIVLTYADAVKQFCKKAFDAGASVLYAYDCSGLGVYWLYNLKKIYKSDVSANTMMQRCEMPTNAKPKKGWWLFNVDTKGKATHIGYMVSDAELVEARGRKYGVVHRAFSAKDWDAWGIPNVFADDIKEPEPEPTPIPAAEQVQVIGGSVNVRTADNKKTGKVLFTAHRGNKFKFVSVAPSGWYEISTVKGNAFISNREDLTKLI